MASTAVVYQIVARDGASKVLSRIGSEAGHTESAFSKLGTAAVRAGAVLGAALGAGLAKSVQSAAKFQASMAHIQTQAGGTAKDVKVLSAAVLNLGTTTQQGPQQLSEALFHLKSVGMDNADAMKALKVSSDLAAVGGANLEDTTNALAGAWRSGIKGAQSFGETASTVNAIIGAGNMKMTDFTAAIGTGILPAARTWGVSLKSIGAALALMTDEGVPATDAATRLKMSLSLMGAPSKQASAALSRIGVTGLQLGNAMRSPGGLVSAISLLKTHLDSSGLSATRQAQLLSQAFGGGRSSSAILTMVNNLSVLKKKQDQINDSTGKYAEAVAAQKRTASAQWAILESNLEVASIRLGQPLLAPLTSFVKYIVGTVMPATSTLSHAVVSMIPVAKIESGFKGLEKGVSDFISGFKGPKKVKRAPVNVDLPVNVGAGPSLRVPASPLLTVMSGATSGPAAKQLSAAQKLGAQIRQAISGGVAGINWSKLGSALGSGLSAAIGFLAGHANDWSNKIAKILGKIDWLNVGKSVGGNAIGFALGFISNLGADLFSASFWKKHWLDVIIGILTIIPVGKIADGLGKLVEHIPWGKAFDGVADLLKKLPFAEWIGRAFSKVADVAKVFGAAVAHMASGFYSDFTKFFSQKVPDAAAWLGKKLEMLPTALYYVGDNLLKAGGRLIDSIGTGVANRVPWLLRKFAGFFTKFTLIKSGGQLILGLLNGIWNGIKAVGGWLKSHVVDPVVNGVKHLFGIHSPSTVFSSIGGDLVRGLLSGIAGIAKTVGSWLKTNLINRVILPFAMAQAWLLTRGAQFVKGLLTGAWSILKTVGSWLKTNFIDRIILPFAMAEAWLITRGMQFVKGLLTGAWSVLKTIGSWLNTNFIQRIILPFARAEAWLITRGMQFVQGLLSGIWSIAKTVGTWLFAHVINPAVHVFVNAASWLYNHGRSIISGLLSGIWNGMTGIASWLKSHVWSPIVKGVKKLFGIHSPSTVMADMGVNLIRGLIQGLIKGNAGSFVSKVFGGVSSTAGEALSWLVKNGLVALSSLGNVASSVWNKISGLFSTLFGGGSGGGSGVSQYASDILQVLKMLGESPGWLSTVERRMSQESGGDSTIVNKWDSNWAAGTPSVGLMQVIGPTFDEYAGLFKNIGPFEYGVSTNPMANIYAGLNYALHRYGSLSALNQPGGYDSGGLAMGAGYLPKYTPKPERVLSPRQTASFEQLVDVLGQQSTGGSPEVHVYIGNDEITNRVKTVVKQGAQQAAFRQRVGRR